MPGHGAGGDGWASLRVPLWGNRKPKGNPKEAKRKPLGNHPFCWFINFETEHMGVSQNGTLGWYLKEMLRGGHIWETRKANVGASMQALR